MPTDPEFAPGLYRGIADMYDRFRLPYSDRLIGHLLEQVRPSGRGRALDLGCGTGQLAFALAGAFSEVWAVDQEPDMIGVVRSKIAAGAAQNVRTEVADAEELDAPAGVFELIVIGNAFHRMARQRVGRRAAGWLGQRGHLALCWSSAPWIGEEPWQQAVDDLLAQWRRRLRADSRIPRNWSDIRTEHPDEAVLATVGFVRSAEYQVTEAHQWTPARLAGFVYATSFLPITIFGERTTEFEADVDEVLHRYADDGVVTDQVSFVYDLFSRPESAHT